MSKTNQNDTYLGIELGSTRIKAVLINNHNEVLASGVHDWENKFINGYWTYAEKDIISGLQNCFKNLKNDFYKKFKITLSRPKSVGISGMMHGYIVLDKNDKMLVPFRTWRNTSTKNAVEFLSPYLNFNIPQRWSIAHLYQAILNKESHVSKINYITTVAGYIHFLLTGSKVVGVGEASGMFPIDSETIDYDEVMVEKINRLFKKKHLPFTVKQIFPKVLVAGQKAGILTNQGALLLDPQGDLQPRVLFAPPEGDAGTGMVSTNAVKPKTGNVSAGTSVFSMIVLNKKLLKWYEEIDIVNTPDGLPVAMIHCNNCSTDINNWINIFQEYNKLINVKLNRNDIFKKIFNNTLHSDIDSGYIFSCNYYSGEPVTNFYEGRPMLVWHANSKLTLANLFKTFLYTSLVTLKIGFDFLRKENVSIDSIVAHGGLFATERIGQKILAAALNTKVTVNKNASDGGPYGMALLAKYIFYNKIKLPIFLAKDPFKNVTGITLKASRQEINSFNNYATLFKKGLHIEREAIKQIKDYHK